MLRLKVVLAMLGYILIWLQAFLDYRNPYKDGRTRLHRYAFRAKGGHRRDLSRDTLGNRR